MTMTNATSANATALPEHKKILEAYCEWLHMEKRLLNRELYPDDDRNLTPCNTLASHFWENSPRPSTRALAILTAVGVLPTVEALPLYPTSRGQRIAHLTEIEEIARAIAANAERMRWIGKHPMDSAENISAALTFEVKRLQTVAKEMSEGEQ